MLYAILTMPDYSSIMNATNTAYATGLFTDLLPWALGIAALIIGALAAKKLGSVTLGAVKTIFGGKRRGGRRRR